jgi:hypothetical protein
MKIRRLGFAVAIAMLSPGAAHAATTCLDTYYKCLNNTWDTSGFERFLADLECGTEYIGCLRKLL